MAPQLVVDQATLDEGQHDGGHSHADAVPAEISNTQRSRGSERQRQGEQARGSDVEQCAELTGPCPADDHALPPAPADAVAVTSA
ncbi:hypothetical protein SDC9_59635 [bioreactor metagenome]|uniref:Uncharacterized protein n=1 Tax=bioreactor metagenome TaxID=1076179 RepID=A0A644XB01_9ZZZZ